MTYDQEMRIWNLDQELCSFVSKIESKKKIKIFSCDAGTFAFNGNFLLDIENYSYVSKETQSFPMDGYEIMENKKLLYYNQSNGLNLKSLLNYENASKIFMALKNSKTNIEFAIKNNHLLYPFSFNMLHIIAIFDDLKDFDMEIINWNSFNKMKLPISPFLSLDFEGRTCFDILFEKKNKTGLNNFFQSIISSLQDQLDDAPETHFYQKLRFFSYDFNYQKKSFMSFMNRMLDFFEEETEVLDKFVEG